MTPKHSAVLCVLLLSSGASYAERPARAEGLIVRLDVGYADWSLNAAQIQAQPNVPPGDVQPSLVDQTEDGPFAALELGYNIKGHVSILASLSATGWDVTTRDRGGGGFGALLLAWHPVELVPPLRDRSWDVSFFFGAGYGVVGEVRAMDGLHLQMGGRAEYYVTDWFSAGASLRYVPLQFSRYVLDWNNEVSVPLPQGSGGSVLIPALSLTTHAPLGA